MAETLDPTGSPVVVGDVTLVTPGLVGVAEAHLPDTPGMRAAESSTPELDEALLSEALEPQETVEISETEEIDLGATSMRGQSTAETMEVTVPDPGEGWGQVLLATDEGGVMMWNVAPPAPQAPSLRAESDRTYTVRRSVPAPDGDRATRGLIGAIGTKILKVLAFKLIDRVAGEVGDYFAGRWEAAKRPYQVRTFGPTDYSSPAATMIDGEGWHRLQGGRALLMLHGTFSRTYSAFGGMPAALVQELYQRYDGRVFAFDHFTLSHDPRANVEVLLEHVPDGTQLELDVVCHSRGGLVARVIAEKQSEIGLGSRQLRIRRVAFVGTPNAGTILADADHFGELVDTYTNLLNFFPDTGVVEVLQTVIAVVKQLAVGAVHGLDGLMSMAPGGSFLSMLNSPANPQVDYFALASNYEPQSPGLKDWATDVIVDRLFSEAENDLVVPTQGVYAANGSALFPIQSCAVLSGRGGVGHSHYFSSDLAHQKLREWLCAT